MTLRRSSLSVPAALALLIAAASALASPAAARPIVVFLSDFGEGNEAPALCEGAMLAINPDIEVVHLTHAIRPYDIREAASVLGRATTFPRGTVFVAVVDPGVGTKRRAIALRTKDGSYFVAPDNGLLTEVIQKRGVAQAVKLDERRVNPAWKPGTFDGRDLFAPAAAKLATSRDLTLLGSPIDPAGLVLLEEPADGVLRPDGAIEGIYQSTDAPYGNIWTNISKAVAAKAGLAVGTRLDLMIGEERLGESAKVVHLALPLVTSFGDVAEGEALAYFNSEGRLSFALNMGNLSDSLHVNEGAPVLVRAVK